MIGFDFYQILNIKLNSQKLNTAVTQLPHDWWTFPPFLLLCLFNAYIYNLTNITQKVLSPTFGPVQQVTLTSTRATSVSGGEKNGCLCQICLKKWRSDEPKNALMQ